MYEEEYNKNILLTKKNKEYKLDLENLKNELKYQSKNLENKIRKATEKATSPLIEKISDLEDKLNNAYVEIDRLKSQLEEKNYKVDKLECSVHKDSTNSGIPTSKEIGTKHIKSGTNTYNHREKGKAKTGGQLGHKGHTLTKEKLTSKIKEKNIKVKKITHYIIC